MALPKTKTKTGAGLPAERTLPGLCRRRSAPRRRPMETIDAGENRKVRGLLDGEESKQIDRQTDR